MTKDQKYDPAVDVIPLTEWKPQWDTDELEPVLFVLKHPVVLQAGDGKVYRHPAGTTFMIMGLAKPDGS